MSITTVTASAVGLALAWTAIAAVHVYWAAGGSWGSRSAIPELHGSPTFSPGPAACLLVSTLLMSAALIVSMQAGLMPALLQPSLNRALTWAIAIVFSARAVGDFKLFGLFRRVTDTAFAEQDAHLYTPLCILFASASAFLALQAGPSE